MNLKPSLFFLLLTATPFLGTVFSEDDERQEVDISLLPPASERQGLTYENDIKPVLQRTCFRCHGEEKQKGELRLDSLTAALKGGEDGAVIIPGEGANSQLVISAARIDRETAMPPMRKLQNVPDAPAPKTLTPEEVGLLRAWIDQGAK